MWYGSKTEVVRQIGNAVPVNTARAILSCMIRQTILQETFA
jgi:site-specific DNA-cytosine methylase